MDLRTHDTFRRRQVTVAVPDATRPIDLDATVRPLLSQLRDVEAEVTVIVALGLHRPMTDDELAPLRAIADRFGARLLQHDASVESFSEDLTRADILVCVGVVEPHQYAGYSGGVKTIAIGCAPGHEIAEMHGMRYLRDPRVMLGRYRANPFQEALWDRVRELPPIWGLYVVPDPNGDDAIFWGEAAEAMDEAVARASQRHFRLVSERVDWLHLRVPPSKGANIYQASRAATYAGLVEEPAVREGGLLIVEASAPEGIGEGKGERACAAAMRRGRHALLDELRSAEPVDTEGGMQRAYVIARTLANFEIAFVGTECGPLPELEAMGIPQLSDADAARRHFGVEGPGDLVEDPFHQVRRHLPNRPPDT